jgi:hypothetical protein
VAITANYITYKWVNKTKQIQMNQPTNQMQQLITGLLLAV